MLINMRPLKKYRDYRLLFFGQLISFLGSMVSYVAIPYQVYELTKDNWLVGMLGLVQLLPVLIFGILGGTFADRLDRRKLLVVSEIFLSILILGLFINACLDKPSIPAIFVLIALFQSVLGFHRPAMDALTQKLVEPEDYAAIGALGSFRYSAGAIVGPALGGLFRGIIWNETVPNDLRGRLSGIEMISYMSGPLLGNARAGWVASKFSVPASVSSGGFICVLAVTVTAFVFLSFGSIRVHSEKRPSF